MRGLKSTMLYPVKIQKMRLNVTIKNYYEDLKLFCKTKKWYYEEPTKKPIDFQSDKIIWENNMISFSEISRYQNDSIREIHIGYTIPSFIGPPITGNEIYEGKIIPQIGYEHIISLLLANDYPAHVAQTHIQSVSTVWHNNFYFLKKGYAHGCVLISGEVDGMAMNLFQQLLWNPEFVWQNNRGKGFSLNQEAFNYSLTNGNDFLHRVLLNRMDKMFSL